jgi:hypothetical protein
MVHGIPPLGAIASLRGLERAIVHAECAEASGQGYYAAGLRLDVPDVPTKLEPSGTSCGHGRTVEPEDSPFTKAANGRGCQSRNYSWDATRSGTLPVASAFHRLKQTYTSITTESDVG